MTIPKKKYTRVCYSKTFLKDVILRVDFATPLASLAKKLPSKLSKAALTRFPVSEPQKIMAQELQFSATGAVSSNSREETQWVYFGKNREKSIVIAPAVLVMRTGVYSTYEDMVDSFFSVFSVLAGIEPDMVISRVGLRYVNVIELPDGSPLDWDEYVDASLLGVVRGAYRKQNLSRAFHILEYAFDNINLKCQFGIANPDYPALMKRRQFVIDIDAYSSVSHDVDALHPVVDDAHAVIQDFFESAITDKTRRLMKSKK